MRSRAKSTPAEKPLRLLLTSDWQASVANLDKCRAVLQHVLKLIAEKHIDVVIHLGDVKDAFNPLDQRVIDFLIEMTTEISRAAEFHVLMGNHDRAGLSDDAGSCANLLMAAGAHVHDTPTVVDRGGWRFHFAPYCRDLIAARKALRKLAAQTLEGRSLLFFHQEVSRAKLNASAKIKSGLRRARLRLKRYRMAFGGHIHMPQQLTENAWYVGSPFIVDWAEANQKKSMTVLELLPDVIKTWWAATELPGLYRADAPIHSALPGSTIRAFVGSEAARTEAIARLTDQYPGCTVEVFIEEEQAPDVTSLGHVDNAAAVREYVKQAQGPAEAVAYLTARLHDAGALQWRSHRQVKFWRARGKNFLSFGEAELTFEDGLCVVTGENLDWADRSNGAGKTSLVQLPLLALYGETLDGRRGDGWRNEREQGTSEASVDFDLSEGHQFFVHRRRGPDAVSFHIDGQAQPLAGKDALDKELRELTGLTWEIMAHCVYTNQHEISRLLIGTDKERKQVLSDFLGLQHFEKALDACRADLKASRESLVALQTTAASCATQVEEATRLLNQSGATDAVREYTAAKKKLAKLESAATGTDFQWRLKKAVAAFKTAGDARDKNHHELVEKTAQLIEAQSHARVAEKELSMLDKSPSTCPTCGRAWNKYAEHRKKIAAHLKQVKEEASKFAAEEKALVALEVDLNTKLRCAEQAYDGLVDESSRAEEALKHLREQVPALHRECSMHAKLGLRRKRLLRNLRIAERALLEAKSDVDMLAFCERALAQNGLPAFLVERMCPLINAAAKKFSRLFSDGQISVQFRLIDRRIEVDVQNKNGAADLHGQSRGEIQIASLITTFALREVMMPTNLLVLDEPGDGLDEANARQFARCVRRAAENAGAVYLITHNAHMLSELSDARRIHVRKQNGISTVN